MKTRKLTELALLATIALTIFLVELRIPNPIPIPGVKLGLANIVTVYAVYRYRPGEVLLLVMTRILLGAILGGNLMSLLYSMAGGLLCLTGMIPLHHNHTRTDAVDRQCIGRGTPQCGPDHRCCLGDTNAWRDRLSANPAGDRMLCRGVHRPVRTIHPQTKRCFLHAGKNKIF